MSYIILYCGKEVNPWTFDFGLHLAGCVKCMEAINKQVGEET